MQAPRVTLEQWRTLQAVIDCGGYAQAAESLKRSQSSVSYAIGRLQKQLGVTLLRIKGRKAVLTEAGEVLLQRSRQLLADAVNLETLGQTLESGWEPEIRLVVDEAFPAPLLMSALKSFEPLSRGTRIQLREVVLSGASEALLDGADLVIGYQVPQGFLGDTLLNIEFTAVAHPDHSLHQHNRELSANDIGHEMQVVIRDSGSRPQDVGWLGAGHRWTVSSIATAITTISSGLGFGWLPNHAIERQLQEGTLKPLPLRGNQSYSAQLYLIFGRQEGIGPATRKLAEILYQACGNTPTEQPPTESK
ncbi:LysR family transcriptional regulator [Solemya pervernicosa gill symbiont]|uniref:LysR family transcriptional regulator n=2 Tax=Gammaproteobacteria incertae sedis TaxID=118884 RepID=A0A1T2L7C9_9GAMM|nr:LysR family transcriptional regulator [Candidatus Reidiella endopervernicosa]OOZ40991.1 LysR family transcriptional regulator [Solemya pervernicosa gill symbiont]QKQ25044.1 LysR family transcriptional regulator [Candidatus Reidiella endopervernicosa]